MSAAKRLRVRKETLDAIKLVEKLGCPFRARGNVWRRVGQAGHFWVCDLLLENHSFSDRPRKGYLLPTLEDIEPIEGCLFDRPAYPAELANESETDESRVVQSQVFSAPGNAQRDEITQEQHVAFARHGSATEFKDWQYEPLRRVLNLPFPRLLLADDVGLGKTTEAGIIASHLVRQGQAERILIICPAHLQEKWREELGSRFSLNFELFNKTTRQRLSRTGIRNPWSAQEFVVVSMDFAKRWENLRPLRNVEWDLVIVDEAHHYMKTAAGLPARLRTMLEEVCTTSPGLLLLTATPFRGGPSAIDSLHLLLDPVAVERDASGELTGRARNRRESIVVRRLKRDVGRDEFPERKVEHLDAARHVMAIEASIIRDFTRFCATVAASTTGAPQLLVEVLRKRASSSWSALVETLGKLKDQELAGTLPDDFVPRIRTLTASHDDAKSRTLANLVKSAVVESGEKLVIFTEFIPSLRHVCSLLEKEFPQISFGAITGTECFARFQGKMLTETDDGLTRAHIEEAFAGRENPIRILVCTDAMSEGKDFQHACRLLVNYELPWSLVRLEQRAGRVDRFGQKHPNPKIYNLVFATDATPDQKILQDVAERIEEWRHELGSVSDLVEAIEEEGLQDPLLAGRIPDALRPERLASLRGEQKSAAVAQPKSFPASKGLGAGLPGDGPALFAKYALRTVLHGTEGYLRACDDGMTGIFELALPDGWELRGREMNIGYPRPERPWRVCLDPDVYRKYEARQMVERTTLARNGTQLEFLSPTHPVVSTAINRFKGKVLASGKIPVLVAPRGVGSLREAAFLLYEAQLCARGEKSIILWRTLATVSPEGHALSATELEMVIPALRAPVRGDRLGKAIPDEKQWAAMVERATERSRSGAADFLNTSQSALEAVRSESDAASVAAGSGDEKLVDRIARAKAVWIDELWEPTIDDVTSEPASRFVPLALVLVPRSQ